MTILNLLLDSSLAKKTYNHNQKSHDFTIYFNQPIELNKNRIYKAALNELITMSCSCYNVRQTYNNYKVRRKKKTDAEWKDLVFQMECIITVT